MRLAGEIGGTEIALGVFSDEMSDQVPIVLSSSAAEPRIAHALLRQGQRGSSNGSQIASPTRARTCLLGPQQDAQGRYR